MEPALAVRAAQQIDGGQRESRKLAAGAFAVAVCTFSGRVNTAVFYFFDLFIDVPYVGVDPVPLGIKISFLDAQVFQELFVKQVVVFVVKAENAQVLVQLA